MGWKPTGGGASPLTTKGDVYTYDTADARLAVGADDEVLTADSAQSLGVKWAAAAGGGGDVWQNWTPTWTGATTNPAIGNGTLAARYIQIGSGSGTLVMVHLNLSMGSTTTYGSGNWRFDVPVGAVAETVVDLRLPLGWATGFNNNVSIQHKGFVRWRETLNLLEIFMDNSSGVPVGAAKSSVPFTWATNDQLALNFNYEVA